jgi:hypothetical protein
MLSTRRAPAMGIAAGQRAIIHARNNRYTETRRRRASSMRRPCFPGTAPRGSRRRGVGEEGEAVGRAVVQHPVHLGRRSFTSIHRFCTHAIGVYPPRPLDLLDGDVAHSHQT